MEKAQYKIITGREQRRDKNVLFYQIRQSFVEGEITHEDALRIGHDLAMRWTKGNHAFFVVSHIDRPHPHIHIYYNSTSLDCTRKFRNFWGSTKALQRLSDRICYENGLSVIENPKLHSKGQFKHYGEWAKGKIPPTFQARLKAQIDACLAEQPDTFEAFLQAMTMAGWEVKHRRGAISFRTEGQKRFTRLSAYTLGKGYDVDDIKTIIAERKFPVDALVKPPSKRLNLIVDIQRKMREGKGAAYENWAKIHNLKAMAVALQYLQENALMDYADLEKKAHRATAKFHELGDKMQSIETAQKNNKELKSALVDWARTRAVFESYKATKYSNKYLAEHEADIQIHRAAQAEFKRLLNGAKLPKMTELKAESARLKSEKSNLYKEYQAIREDMKTVITAKANIDHLLGLSDNTKSENRKR